MRTFKTVLLASIATAALAPTASFAQAADDGAETGEIIVTARRQNERLVEVPASVSVLSADMLAKTGAQSAEDFTQLTPGVTIVTGTAEAGDTQINIRGINGARDAESSVALVVDGILKTNTAQLNQSQGTLAPDRNPERSARRTLRPQCGGGRDRDLHPQARRQARRRHPRQLCQPQDRGSCGPCRRAGG